MRIRAAFFNEKKSKFAKIFIRKTKKYREKGIKLHKNDKKYTISKLLVICMLFRLQMKNDF